MNSNNPDLRHLPPDLPQDQLDRVHKILEQVLIRLRGQSRNLPPEAALALTYELQPEADR